MDPLLRVGLELPALTAPLAARASARGAGTGGITAWRTTAVAAASTRYFGAVWATGGPGAVGGDDGEGPTCDACTMAGGLVRSVPDVLLGVVAGVGPGGRHPSVLARDVTGLDVVSSGRAAVLLCAARTGGPAVVAAAAAPAGVVGVPGGGGPGVAADRADRLWALAEAAAVCRSLFTEAHPVFGGRFFHVAGAVNRPGPVRAGGPPLLVQVTSGPGGAEPPPDAAPEGEAAAKALALVARVADAVVVTGSPAAVAAWRRALDEAVPGAPRPAPATAGARVPIVWRGRVGVTGGPSRGAARRAAELVGAGAEGLIVRVEPAGGSAAVGSLAEVLSAVVPGAT